MAKIYNIETKQDVTNRTYVPLNIQNEENENTTTYFEVLKIFRTVFNFVDFNHNITRHK